jgi:hypothetical protein
MDGLAIVAVTEELHDRFTRKFQSTAPQRHWMFMVFASLIAPTRSGKIFFGFPLLKNQPTCVMRQPLRAGTRDPTTRTPLVMIERRAQRSTQTQSETQSEPRDPLSRRNREIGDRRLTFRRRRGEQMEMELQACAESS